MPSRSPGKEERDGTTEGKYPMSITDKIRSKVYGWDPQPSKSGWDRLDTPDEDFAADSRAEVSKPKGGRS